MMNMVIFKIILPILSFKLVSGRYIQTEVKYISIVLYKIVNTEEFKDFYV